MAPIAFGFKKLTTDLEDEELDEYGQVNLATLSGDEESEEGENDEDEDEDEDEEIPEIDKVAEGGSGFGSQGAGTEEGESSGDEDGLALDELEDVELHPDVVPRRNVKVVDNKVRATWA
jgi:hypothetical protein